MNGLMLPMLIRAFDDVIVDPHSPARVVLPVSAGVDLDAVEVLPALCHGVVWVVVVHVGDHFLVVPVRIGPPAAGCLIKRHSTTWIETLMVL